MRSFWNITLLSVMALCLAAGAAPSTKTVLEGQRLLEQGEIEQALAHFRELQVEHPDAPEVRFAIGCVLLAKAERHCAEGLVEDGATAYAEARAIFDALTSNVPDRVSREAYYNRASSLVAEGLTLAEAGDYAGGVALLRQAVQAFEQGVERYPEHPGMGQNLEHTRLRLKQLLQNPPPEQEQSEQQQPPEPQEGMMSRFGQVSTGLPGARTRHEDNMAILVPPGRGEDQP